MSDGRSKLVASGAKTSQWAFHAPEPLRELQLKKRSHPQTF